MTQLQEYVDSRGVALSVDREAGILRGVKLIGLESRNGRRYRESALSAAEPMYEGAKVNINHSKDGPLTPRDYQDRLGVIRGVRMRSGEGLFGDLHFNPKHALAEQLLWDAEHNPQNVGFSHNVLARLDRKDNVATVEEITKVQSVDLVADPATTQGLFEQSKSITSVESSQPAKWDALTVEVLELHRPDLLSEIRLSTSGPLKSQLEEAESRLAQLKRKQRIYELLCEHELSVSPEEVTQSSNPKQVSTAFVELLMSVSEEHELEMLIAERGSLATAIEGSRANLIVHTPPFSRDQTLFAESQQGALCSAEEFAANLKSALN